VKFVNSPKVEISVSKLIEPNVIIQRAGTARDVHGCDTFCAEVTVDGGR
jgi:hypothetical protein